MTAVRAGAATPSARLPVELRLLGLLALLWGSSCLLIKVAVETIPPVTLIAARVTIAALVLGPVLAWRGERLPRDARSWRRLLVQAPLNSIGAWTALAWGQQHVDSGLASVLDSTSPIFVLLFALATRGLARTGALRVAGAGLGLVGIVLIVGPDVLRGLGREAAAQLAVLTGAVLYAVAAIHGLRLLHLSATVTAAGTMLWATVCLLPAALVLDRPWTLAPSAASLAAALALGTLGTGVALLIHFRLIRTLGPIGVASQSYLRAAVGVALGLIVLGESVAPVAGLGLGAAVLGVALINAPHRHG